MCIMCCLYYSTGEGKLLHEDSDRPHTGGSAVCARDPASVLRTDDVLYL